MKPKERFYGYALMPDNCDRDATKQDSPIDLSTKRHSPTIVHSISPYASSDYDLHSIESPPNYNEWSSKYSNVLLSNASARNLQIQAPPNLLPYILLNRSCFDNPSSPTDSGISSRTAKTDVVYDQYGNPYRVGDDQSLIPLRSTQYIDLYKRNAHNGSHVSPNSLSNSPSPSTHNSPQQYNETKRLLQQSPTNSSASLCQTPIRKDNRSHNRSTNIRRFSSRLKRSFSFPSISKDLSQKKTNFRTTIYKSKSESNLNVLYHSNNNYKKTETSSKPKCLNLSRNDSESVGNNRLTKQQHNLYLSQYYSNKESEIIDSDQEKEDDIIESGTSDDYGSDDALDLRVSNSIPKFPVDLSHSGSESLFHHINAYLSQHSPRKHADELSPQASPIELYRQYYYYLMHQSPAFASRAVAAVAVAETYAKLISNASHTTRNIHHHSSVDNCDNNTSIYENENTSPDYIMNGSRTELRSADTTNSLPFDRKRISRPLTGKHVRHGTGASPSTLLSLRNMIQERQRLKEIGALEVNKYGKGKGGKRVKRK